MISLRVYTTQPLVERGTSRSDPTKPFSAELPQLDCKLLCSETLLCMALALTQHRRSCMMWHLAQVHTCPQKLQTFEAERPMLVMLHMATLRPQSLQLSQALIHKHHPSSVLLAENPASASKANVVVFVVCIPMFSKFERKLG